MERHCYNASWELHIFLKPHSQIATFDLSTLVQTVPPSNGGGHLGHPA